MDWRGNEEALPDEDERARLMVKAELHISTALLAHRSIKVCNRTNAERESDSQSIASRTAASHQHVMAPLSIYREGITHEVSRVAQQRGIGAFKWTIEAP